MKKLLLITSLVLLPFGVNAAEFKSGDEVSINEVVNEDLYIGGGIVDLNAEVNGDLWVAGGQVNVSKRVSEDLNIGGGEVRVSADVGDDLKIAGGEVRIQSNVKGDMILGAGEVRVEQGSLINGDLIFGAGDLRLEGDVNGDLLGGTGSIYLNGTIKGNVRLLEADRISFGPDGVIEGDLNYRSREQLSPEDEARVKGEINYKASVIASDEGEKKHGFKKVLKKFSFFKLFSLLFVGLILTWLLKFYMVETDSYAKKNTLKCLGIGTLLFIGIPVGALFLAVTVIGLPLAAIAFVTWGLLIYIAKFIASIFIGSLIIKLNKKSSFLRIYGALALGGFIFILLGLIPIVGWAIKALLCLIGMGAILGYEKGLFDHLRSKKMI